jgi:hypothetical protein
MFIHDHKQVEVAVTVNATKSETNGNEKVNLPHQVNENQADAHSRQV